MMVTGSDRRIGTRSVRLTVVLGLLLIGAIPQQASAEEMDKGAFKKGCESGGGSYLESADGSFQCNTKSGGTVKCQDTKRVEE